MEKTMILQGREVTPKDIVEFTREMIKTQKGSS